MPARRLSMRKLREVLRLRYELKLGYQQIGRSCAIGVGTVHKYLKRAEAAGVTWPLPEDWDEARIGAVVFPRRVPSIAERGLVFVRIADQPPAVRLPGGRRAKIRAQFSFGGKWFAAALSF